MTKSTTMKIDEVEYVRADSIEKPAPVIISSETAPWEIGKHYLIRTVTMIDTGTLAAVTPQELVLIDACWIPDTGRFSEALESVEFDEVEPFPSGNVIIGRGSVIDAIQIDKFKRSKR